MHERLGAGGQVGQGWSLEVEYRRASGTSWAMMRWANDRWWASGFGQVDKLDEKRWTFGTR